VCLPNDLAFGIGLTMQRQVFLNPELRKAITMDGFTNLLWMPYDRVDQHVSKFVRHLVVWRMARV